MIQKLFTHDHEPSHTRIVVAMSGGVDSSVAAALVAEAGYDVVGITLQLYDYGQVAQKKGTCCAGQDIYDARRVAEHIGFPHYVLDYEQQFRSEVIDDFVSSYLHGETPIPCVRCNQNVKFRDLLTTAHELGAAALVTGHYVQRFESPHGGTLHQAVDPDRDQSYFLFGTTQKQLDFLRFPLGNMLKSDVRAHAHRFGLEIAEKPDSQDICFVPDGKYARVIERLRPGSIEAGNIIDVDGKVLGRHQGIIHYTIGQRRGIGISSREPLYVIDLDPESHNVVVGHHEYLRCQSVTLKDVNWLASPEFCLNKTVNVKYRSMHNSTPARLEMTPEGVVEVVFLTEEYGVSAGQACVFYEGDRVLGGGWIDQALTMYHHHRACTVLTGEQFCVLSEIKENEK